MNVQRTRAILLAGALLVVAVTGCIGGEETGLDPANAEASASLAEPPDLRVGDWWTYEVRHDATGTATQTTIVVTERSQDTATIGMAEDAFAHQFLLLHVPPLGVVELDSLSWHVMWERFEPARFPLEPGQTWTTAFHGAEVDAEVTEVSRSEAHVTMVGDNERVELAYDAEAGVLSSLELESYGASVELVDHGTGYEGTVMQFRNVDLGFFTGRLASAIDPELQPAAPVETVGVPDDVSHGTLGLLAGSLQEDAPGVYRAQAEAPDGASFEATFTPTPGDPALVAEFFGHDAVQGNWELDFESAGPGFVAAELIVYDLDEVTLGGEQNP